MTVRVSVKRRVLVLEGDGPALQNPEARLGGIQEMLHPPLDFERNGLEEVSSFESQEDYEVVCGEKGASGWDLIKEALRQDNPYALVFIGHQSLHLDEMIQSVERLWQEDPVIQLVLCLDSLSCTWTTVLNKLSKPDQVFLLRIPLDPIEVRQVATVLTQKRHWQLEAAGGMKDRSGIFQPSPVLWESTRKLGDFDDWEHLEKTLRCQTEELSRSNRELEQFASVAAHDLREPLHTIQVYLDLLQVKFGKDLSAKGLTYVDKAKRGADRLQKLIQGLLVYSKVQEFPKETSSVCLRGLVDEILDDFESQISRNQVWIEVNELPTIQGDLIGLRQLLQNLIGNALKFQKQDQAIPKIQISGQIIQKRRQHSHNQASHLCQIQVQDWGIGIPDEKIEKIFGMFKRLHRDNEYEGVGIGLAICKKVVERWGGQISIQSTLGEGSIFTVTFPVPPPVS